MKKKLTIGIFNDSFYPLADGVIMVLDNYARRLLKYANVIVFVPSYKNKFYDDSKFPYKVVRCKSLSIPNLEYTLPMPSFDSEFKKEFERYNLDIVHIHSPFSLGKIGLKYAKQHNIPCIATMHSQFKQDFQKALRNEYLSTKLMNGLIKIFNQCDECWAVNGEVARIYYEDYGYKKMPKVMLNATELKPVIDNGVAREYINKKYNISDNDKVFLFVGRINVLKNIMFIVDSLKLVKEKDSKLKFKMLYVGSGMDYDKLVKYVDLNGLSDDVILCGKVTDRQELSYYYKRADLFLFPSVYDASSIVQIEAASQSTPTVFLSCAATAATVTDNVNGFLSDYSADAYSDKIIEVMHDKDLYDKVSKKAFDDLYIYWDDKIDEVYKLYKEIIKKNKEKN